MSIRATNYAFSIGGISPTQKLILLTIADSADDLGHCRPSKGRIALYTGVSERTVQRAIKFFVSQNILTKQSRFTQERRQTSNLYIFTFIKREGDILSPSKKKYKKPLVSTTKELNNSAPEKDTAKSHQEPPEESPQQPPVDAPQQTIIWADNFSLREIQILSKYLKGISDDSAQMLVDELVGAKLANVDIRSDVAWLRSMVQKFKSGTFEGTYCLNINRKKAVKEVSTFKTTYSEVKDNPQKASVEFAKESIKSIKDKLEKKMGE